MAYVDEEDELYTYGTMASEEKARFNISNDKVDIGGPLPKANGRFADVKMATLRAQNGETTVVAKMNKGILYYLFYDLYQELKRL